MTAFRKAVISTPGKERITRTPFGDRIVIHATAQETNGAYGVWETFPEPGKGRPCTRIRARPNVFASCAAHTAFGAARTSLMFLPAPLSYSLRMCRIVFAT
jgi:hypothetical protein